MPGAPSQMIWKFKVLHAAFDMNYLRIKLTMLHENISSKEPGEVVFTIDTQRGTS